MLEPEHLAGFDDGRKEPAEQLDVIEPPAGVPPVGSPELKTLVSIAVGAIVVATLYVAQDVLIPITLAVMLSFVLSPLVDLLRRIGLWRAAAVALSVLVALGAIALTGTLLGNQIATLAADVPHYAEAVESKVGGVQALATTSVAAVTRIFTPVHESPAAVVPVARPRGGKAEAPALPPGGTPEHPLVVELAPPASSVLTVARTIIEPVLGPLETTVIVFIVAIFILMQREDLRDRFIRLVGSKDLHRTTRAMDDVGQRLSRYFLSQLGVNASFGTVIGVGLWLIGVPSPALWGVLAGLLRFVPYVGPLLAAVVPLTLAVAVDPGWRMAVYVALLFLTVEPLTAYLVEPLLYGHSTGLSPVSVIVAAVFWTWIWGPVGLILSTPMTMCLVIMGRHVRSLGFLDVLLGDRQALSDVDRFYQRMLADDPDEALAQAETMLADRSLVDYYDSVVLPALKLAAADEARGTITGQRASEMTRSILEVIGDLSDYAEGADATTPKLKMEDSEHVAAVVGRGPFDEPVSAMLVQLLAQRGVRARRIPYASVTRETIAQLDLSAARVIAISHLEVGEAPAQLRYLNRRLRQRAPHSILIDGLWSQGDPVLNDAKAQKALGGDRYVASLRDALEASLAALSDRPAGATRA